MGMETKIGIFLTNSQKHLRIKFSEQKLGIHTMVVDHYKKYLIFATLDHKLYIISITEIKKLIV